MQKQITQFKSVINNIESIFHFESGAPIQTAKEAVLECLKWLGNLEDQIKAAQAAVAPVETPPITDEVENGEPSA
jgi:hypothetical protein